MKSALDKSFRKTGKDKSQIQHHECPSSHEICTHRWRCTSLWCPMKFQTHRLHTSLWKAKLCLHCLPLLVRFHGLSNCLGLAVSTSQTHLFFTSLLFFPNSDPSVIPQAAPHSLTSPHRWHEWSSLSEWSSLLLPSFSLPNRTGRKPLKSIVYFC